MFPDTHLLFQGSIFRCYVSFQIHGNGKLYMNSWVLWFLCRLKYQFHGSGFIQKWNPSKSPYIWASHCLISPPKWVPFHDPISVSVIKNPTSKSLRDGEGVTPGVSGSTREGDAERSVEGRSKRLRKESRENIAAIHGIKPTNFHCLVKLLPSGWLPGDSNRDLFIPKRWRSPTTFEFGPRFHHPKKVTKSCQGNLSRLKLRLLP